jgi:hypothetical protein
MLGKQVAVWAKHARAAPIQAPTRQNQQACALAKTRMSPHHYEETSEKKRPVVEVAPDACHPFWFVCGRGGAAASYGKAAKPRETLPRTITISAHYRT